jgi:hypothetical protein
VWPCFHHWDVTSLALTMAPPRLTIDVRVAARSAMADEETNEAEEKAPHCAAPLGRLPLTGEKRVGST